MYWNGNNDIYSIWQNGWIVTLDVLKFKAQDGYVLLGSLNSNIRCIEMITVDLRDTKYNTLNSNIRCIEITIQEWFCDVSCCWIVTLDVLK